MKDIKEKLLNMRRVIIDNIRQDRDKSTSAFTGDIGDEVDYATQDRNRELYQLLCERDQKKLELIEEALKHIEKGSYGECEECGAEIGKKRLMALLFTKLCLDCKKEQERTRMDVSVTEYAVHDYIDSEDI